MGAAKINMRSKIDDQQANWAIGSTYCQAMHPISIQALLGVDVCLHNIPHRQRPVRKKMGTEMRMETGRQQTPSLDRCSTELLALWEEGAQ